MNCYLTYYIILKKYFLCAGTSSGKFHIRSIGSEKERTIQLSISEFDVNYFKVNIFKFKELFMLLSADAAMMI